MKATGIISTAATCTIRIADHSKRFAETTKAPFTVPFFMSKDGRYPWVVGNIAKGRFGIQPGQVKRFLEDFLEKVSRLAMIEQVCF